MWRVLLHNPMYFILSFKDFKYSNNDKFMIVSYEGIHSSECKRQSLYVSLSEPM